ncbi:hypothetical protein AMK17_19760 [Streptomyces sp. CB00072]|nr:hypothetical protein AMK17_19760 [Streptomyces sp. CB00072]
MFDLLVQPVIARLCMVATAWTAWWRPSPFWRQSRRIRAGEGVLDADASVFGVVLLLAAQE